MSKKSGKKDGKSSNKGGARHPESVPASKETEPKQSFTDEQMANPLFRAALAFRNNPGMLGNPEPEEPKKEGPNFMQRLVARAANDANALCILGCIFHGALAISVS